MWKPCKRFKAGIDQVERAKKINEIKDRYR